MTETQILADIPIVHLSTNAENLKHQLIISIMHFNHTILLGLHSFESPRLALVPFSFWIFKDFTFITFLWLVLFY